MTGPRLYTWDIDFSIKTDLKLPVNVKSETLLPWLRRWFDC